MIANLKTHRVYPEIITDTGTGEWVGKLIAGNGKVEEEYSGRVPVEGRHYKEIRADAAKAAHAKFNLTITNYEV